MFVKLYDVFIKVISIMYDFLIVGAGIFGSCFARIASDLGKKCIVIDKRQHVGGNCYTENIYGINVHKYGAHIFHTNNKQAWQFVNKFAEFNRFTNSPIANYNGDIFHLPFNMNTFYDLWKITSPEDAHKKIESQRIIYDNPQNLEEQALSLVGIDIYKKLIKGYTEKQWGRSCKDLPSFIIKRIPLRFTYDNNYFNDSYQGVPVGGYTKLISNILEGIEVILNTSYNSNLIKAKTTVFTGAIDEYYDYVYGSLEYRSLRFEDEILDCENYQGNAVVNYTSNNIPYTRIIEHKHFEYGKHPKTVITREYPQKYSIGNERFYPVNDDYNNSVLEKYKKLAKHDKSVIFGGRLGEYKYLNMDETIISAISAANRFCL